VSGIFGLLTPELTISAVEAAYHVVLDGTMQPYPSYINRVYGLRDEDGRELVVKFYRPGRWSAEAIADEHRFVLDCAESEIPVVAPIENATGQTVSGVTLSGENGETGHFLFALFPKRSGRNFDAETDDDWFRLGSVIGRCHVVAQKSQAQHRLECRPDGLTRGYLEELLAANLVHPDSREELESVCRETLDAITPLFSGVRFQRVHGDCHRGNILDRPGTGLLIIDFDDMMMGPAVQDLWLLLPDHVEECGRELSMLIDGYTQFADFDSRTINLVEPLRFMRIIYYLAWQARQRDDFRFRASFPDWGTAAFWIKEIEDVRSQATIVRDAIESA